MRKSRLTEPQIMSVLRQAESGVALPELCQGWSVHNRSIGSIVMNNGISTAELLQVALEV